MAAKAVPKTHRERSAAECMNDTIFVLLRSTFHGGRWGQHHVVGVFLSRQEAEGWARWEAHNYGELGQRTIVWAVRAIGELKDVLRGLDGEPAGVRDEAPDHHPGAPIVVRG